LCILKFKAACSEIPIIIINGFVSKFQNVASTPKAEDGVGVAAKGKKTSMRSVLGLILSCVVPIEITFNSKEYTKLRRINVLPQCVASFTPIPKTEHPTDTSDIKIVEPIIFLHRKHR
jgi:hypothetical protein